MSERTEVEVLFPLNREPTREEGLTLLKAAFEEARNLVKPGRVLGMISVSTANHGLTGEPALKVRFAVEAPESIQHSKATFATS